jgi:diacylglycerol kinase
MLTISITERECAAMEVSETEYRSLIKEARDHGSSAGVLIGFILGLLLGMVCVIGTVTWWLQYANLPGTN